MKILLLKSSWHLGKKKICIEDVQHVERDSDLDVTCEVGYFTAKSAISTQQAFTYTVGVRNALIMLPTTITSVHLTETPGVAERLPRKQRADACASLKVCRNVGHSFSAFFSLQL